MDSLLREMQLWFNCNDIPGFHTSNRQLWPLLARVVKPFGSPVVTVGHLTNVRPKPRSGCSFRESKRSRLQTGVILFLTLPINMATTFPVNYMSLVLLEVIKRMFDVWLPDAPVRPYRLSPSSVDIFARRITSFSCITPVTFSSFIVFCI